MAVGALSYDDAVRFYAASRSGGRRVSTPHYIDC
eukprot:COSAG02_NODE_38387_length_429_cov_1.403030_1_plen_33_part_10